MYIYELLDILFFIKSLKSPNNNFNIYIIFLLSKHLPDVGAKNLFILHLATLPMQIPIFVEFLDYGMPYLLLTLQAHPPH